MRHFSHCSFSRTVQLTSAVLHGVPVTWRHFRTAYNPVAPGGPAEQRYSAKPSGAASTTSSGAAVVSEADWRAYMNAVSYWQQCEAAIRAAAAEPAQPTATTHQQPGDAARSNRRLWMRRVFYYSWLGGILLLSYDAQMGTYDVHLSKMRTVPYDVWLEQRQLQKLSGVTPADAKAIAALLRPRIRSPPTHPPPPPRTPPSPPET